jgi:hypothetical protein
MMHRVLRLLAATLALAPALAHAGIIDVTEEQRFAISPTAKITIRNTDGRIYVYGSADAAMRVTALKRAFTQQRVDAIKVNVQIDGDTVVIDTEYPPKPEGSMFADRSGTVDYAILVPEYATLERVELENGEIMIEGMRGAALNANVARGKLILRNCFTYGVARIGEGVMDVFFGWWEQYWPFTVQAEIAKGELRLGLPRDAALRLAAEASGQIHDRYGIRAKEETAPMKTIQTTIGDPLAAEAAQVMLRAANGNIKINKAY